MKKVLLSILALSLVAILSVGATLAYLQDEDGAVNVMTVGQAKIEQHEYQRAPGVPFNGTANGNLVEFVQGQPLRPAVPTGDLPYTAAATDLFKWGSYVYTGTAKNGLWDENKLGGNVLDKFVFVENTGAVDVYFRTVIAFECPEGTEYSPNSDKEFMMNTNGGTSLYKWDEIGYTVIDNTRYLLMTATYLNPLKPGQQAHPSLLQVLMTHNVTNEDIALLGNSYEILVMSQAVQADGFKAGSKNALDTAFGAVTTDNNPWKGAAASAEVVKAANAEGLAAALANADSSKDVTVILDAGNYTFPASSLKKNVTLVCNPGVVFEGKSGLNVNGATVIGATFSNEGGTAAAGTINGTFKNCVFEGSEALRWCYTGETVVFENCTFKTDFRGVHFDGSAGTVIFRNCELSGFNALGGDALFVFDGCTFTQDESSYNGLNLYVDATLTNCTFVFKSGVTNFIDCEGVGQTLTINGCTATLDGAEIAIMDMVGGSKLTQNTVILNGNPVLFPTTGAALADALVNAADDSTVILTAGVDYGTVAVEGELNGVTIVGDGDTDVKFNILSTASLTNVTFTGFSVEYTDNTSAYVDGGIINIDAGAVVKNLVIEGFEFLGSGGRSCAIGISEISAEITLKNCVINGPKYVVYASAPIVKMTIENCEIKNINSWAILMNNGATVPAELTVTGCKFTNCTGGIAKFLGTAVPGGKFVFTNNTLTNCAGHDGSDAKWFALPYATADITISGNTLDGAAWNPGTAQGLGK